MNTFISHVHYQDNQLYSDVLHNLKLIYRDQLRNCSIAEHSRIKMLIDEEAKIEQEIGILEGRITSISNEIKKLEKYVESTIQNTEL